MAVAAHARAEFDLAQMNIRLVVDQLKEDFEFSSQVLTAMRGKQMAYDRYAAARDRVLGKLQSQNDYRTVKQLRDDLANTLDELQANPSGNRARIDATAAVKMQYGTKVSRMESDALLADSNVQDAKAQFVDASNHLTDLRAQFARSIRRDSVFVAARDQLEGARIQRDTSLAFLDGAVQAANIAMNYSYSLHQWDEYKYLSAGGAYPYDVYGYGNGLGYGYGTPISSSIYNPDGYGRPSADEIRTEEGPFEATRFTFPREAGAP